MLVITTRGPFAKTSDIKGLRVILGHRWPDVGSPMASAWAAGFDRANYPFGVQIRVSLVRSG
jgi:hypothetical protein